MADSAMPSETAALMTWNQGRTTPIMMSNPPPSGPSLAAAGTKVPAPEIGRDALPRRPSPSNGPATSRPGAPAGTSQMVLAPAADTGRLAHTHESASPAAVPPALRPAALTQPPP